MIRKYSFIVLAIVSLVTTACDANRVYEENKPLENNQWYFKNLVPFDVQVTDTNKIYNVFVNLRITSDYKYNNIFIWLHTTNPDRKTDKRRVEIKLANDAGKWLGSGLGDLFDYQFPVLQQVKFPLAGFYKFEIEQNMREDTLFNIKAAGIRVEVIE